LVREIKALPSLLVEILLFLVRHLSPTGVSFRGREIDFLYSSLSHSLSHCHSFSLFWFLYLSQTKPQLSLHHRSVAPLNPVLPPHHFSLYHSRYWLFFISKFFQARSIFLCQSRPSTRSTTIFFNLSIPHCCPPHHRVALTWPLVDKCSSLTTPSTNDVVFLFLFYFSSCISVFIVMFYRFCGFKSPYATMV
jgi:hypothetical protein